MSKIHTPKVQHYVPRFILRHFTENNEQIWVFDKRTNKKFKTNIKNVAAETGFYDFKVAGHPVTFEHSLSEFESKAAKVVKGIVKNESVADINEEERLLLSRFLALQFVRTKHWREMWENLTSDFVKSVRNKGLAPEDFEGYKELTDHDNKMFHMQSVYKADEYAPHFLNKIWVLLKATKKHPFWISDNPISLQNMNKFGFYSNIGLAVKGIEIYFPLTKKFTLGLWCKSHKEEFDKLYEKYNFLFQISPQIAADLVKEPSFIEEFRSGIYFGQPISSTHDNIINHNSLQVKYAARYVYSSNDDFSLAEEMVRSHPELKEGPKIKVS
jgi:hypothetical protein